MILVVPNCNHPKVFPYYTFNINTLGVYRYVKLLARFYFIIYNIV